MHVAQFVHRYPPALGGAEAWAARLSRHLLETRHHVTVFTTTAIDLSAFTRHGCREVPAGTTVEDGVEVRRFRPGLRFPGRRLLLKAASAIPVRRWQALTQPWAPISSGMWAAGRGAPRVDVVHAIAFPYSPVIACALRTARRAGARFVITPFLHLGDPDDPRDRVRRAYTAPHLRWLLRQADRVLVQTATEAAAVRGLGVDPSRIVLQGLGVDVRECTGGSRAASRRAWQASDRDLVIGHLANLSPEKGSIDLVRAAARAAETGVPIRLVLAGPAMPAYARFRQQLGEAGWLTEPGPLSNAGRRDFFAGLDAFALPSRSDSFGLVFLEAWANGLPVLGYRCGGVVDVIRHERDGLLVRPGDIGGLADALTRLAMDPRAREEWGRAGRNRLPSDFRWGDKLRVAEAALTDWSLQKCQHSEAGPGSGRSSGDERWAISAAGALSGE